MAGKSFTVPLKLMPILINIRLRQTVCFVGGRLAMVFRTPHNPNWANSIKMPEMSS